MTTRGMLRALSVSAFATAVCAQACATRPAGSVPSSSRAVLSISPERIEELRRAAPELADHVANLQRAAHDYARHGYADIARELTVLSQITLLSALEWYARTKAPEAEQPPTQDLPSESSPELHRETNTETAPGEPDTPTLAAHPTKNPRRRGEGTGRQVDSSRQEDDSVSTAAIAERLAKLADRLAQQEPEASTAEQRVALEQVQTALIEADRALAEGLERRAAEFAETASMLMATYEGEEVSSPDPKPSAEDGLVRDARDALGNHAALRRGFLIVRLDPLITFRNDAWQARDSEVLNHLRAIVRGYRSVPVLLSAIGAGDPDNALRTDALRRYLAGRFQIPVDRLQLTDVPELRLKPGTYLLFRVPSSAR